MVISSPCLTDIKNWLVQSKRLLLASPKQTALGKDISNLLIVDSLFKTIWLSMHHVIAIKHWLFQSKQLLARRSIQIGINTARQHVNTVSPEVNTGRFKLNIVDPSVNTASLNDQDNPKDMFKIGASHTLEATPVEFFNDEDEPEVDLGNILNSYTIPITPNTSFS
ncbi:hypothetical protein Tco_0451597 [Tanacetum coccineum]